jgi:hypothetical protein
MKPEEVGEILVDAGYASMEAIGLLVMSTTLPRADEVA